MNQKIAKKRCVGVSTFGVRAPIIKEGDNITDFVVNALLDMSKNHDICFQNRDIVGVTESLVARAQGNYATLEQITKDIKSKYKNKSIGVVFPITSRNRFSLLLKAISNATEKTYVLFSLPGDEVGNQLISKEKLSNSGIDLNNTVLTEDEYYNAFGHDNKHVFTGMDYVEFYKSINPNIEVLFSNNPCSILKYTKDVLVADIHTRKDTKKAIKNAGANTVFDLSYILSSSVDGSGYNPDYGVLGSNIATDISVKLFPKDCFDIVANIQKALLEKTGKNIEILVYGDSCFKDPVGGIWELADPVVSPGYTDGLLGSPDEIKIKYLAENNLSNKNSKEQEEEIKLAMQNKTSKSERTEKDNNNTLGTTPRRYVDLVGSLCDLTSGSGEKGTPIIYIQGYFDNYADE